MKTWTLVGILFALIGWGASMDAASQRSRQPHFIIFLADDLGWGDVGYHGSDIRTPAIDRLAESGVKLEAFYAQPVCSPTRAALLTGRYPIRYGLQSDVIRPWASQGLPIAERTLADLLRDVGYRTALIGKWHLGHGSREYLPLQRGFEYHYGHYNGAINYFTHERDGGLDWHRNGEALKEEGYATTLIARDAVRLIEQHDLDRPLFLLVAFNAPHAPFQVPEAYTTPYPLRTGVARAYAGMVAAMDEAIGEVMSAVEKRGMSDDTLFVFSSDNGGPSPGEVSNNGPWRGAKGSLHEGGVRVVACAAWPGRIPAGTRVEEPLHMVDWLPTVARLAGVSSEDLPLLDGRDSWGTLATGAPSPHDCILLNVAPPGGVVQGGGAVRAGRWKLTVGTDPASGFQADAHLFDLNEDPRELHNLADRHPEMTEHLLQALRGFSAMAVAPLPSAAVAPKDFHVPRVWGTFAPWAGRDDKHSCNRKPTHAPNSP